MARSPEAQAAHAAHMERVAEERHAENADFYTTAGSFSRAAMSALGLGGAGAAVHEMTPAPPYHGRGTDADYAYREQTMHGKPRYSEPMPRAMGKAQSVYAGKASGAARKVGEELRDYPLPRHPGDLPIGSMEEMARMGAYTPGDGFHPEWDYDAIKKNAKLYEKWSGDASEAYKMASQAWRTGVSPFAEKLAPIAGPAGRALGVATSGAVSLGALPGSMLMSEAGAAGTPYADMHFSAFRLKERPLRSDDVGEEDYRALVNSPEMATDLFEVGAISFELYQKAGNERVEEEPLMTPNPDLTLPSSPNELLAEELGGLTESFPEEQQLMAKAQEADEAQEDAFAAAAPIGDFTKGPLNSLVDSLNKVMPLFGVEDTYDAFTEDIEGALPTEFVRYLMMTTAAATDANLERLAIDLEEIDTDADLMKAAGQLEVLAENDSFRTFMAQQDTEAPVEEEVVEEVTMSAPAMTPDEAEAMLVDRAR